MMTAGIYGRIGRKPKEITTRSGIAMAVTGVAVEVGQKGSQHTLWLDLLCFGELADKLLRHDVGEMVSASGRIALNQWTDNSGQARESWQLLVDTLISARTTRPGFGRRKASESSTPPPSEPLAGAPFDDDLPF